MIDTKKMHCQHYLLYIGGSRYQPGGGGGAGGGASLGSGGMVDPFTGIYILHTYDLLLQ